EALHVVLDDDVGPKVVQDLAQPGLDVPRAVADGPPRGREERRELLDGGFAELRRRVPDEVLPELTGLLRNLGRRSEPHERLLEASPFERAGEGLLDDE